MRVPFIKSTIEKVVETETIYNENNNIHMKMDILRIVNMIRCLVAQREIDQNNYDNLMNIILYIICKTLSFITSNISDDEPDPFDNELYENFIIDLTEQLRNAYCIGYYKLGSSPLIRLMIYQTIDLYVDFYIKNKYNFNKIKDIENLIKKDLLNDFSESDKKTQTPSLIVNIYFTLIVSLLQYKHIKLKKVKRVLKKINIDDVRESCKVLVNHSKNYYEDIDNIIKIFEVNCITLLNLV
jgi:hypothetical protein